MLRILYGGTFDPVHRGHIAIARAVADLFGQPVMLLPSADPPHRPPPGASAEQRATMLDLAVGCDGRLQVDRRELHRQGPSYTVETLAEVRAELGADAAIIWVMGIDSLRQLDSWHDWRRLFELGHVLGVERPNGPVDIDWLAGQAPVVARELSARLREASALSRTPAGGYAPLALQPLRPESATEVRRRIAEGSEWEPLVPAAVAPYIRDQGLYRTGSGGLRV